jgi:hypothetical protein
MYIIEVLERKPESNFSNVIFTKPIPVPLNLLEYDTAENFSEYIKSLKLPWYVKDAYIAQIYYTCHQWFPKNFYTIKFRGNNEL